MVRNLHKSIYCFKSSSVGLDFVRISLWADVANSFLFAVQARMGELL